ncbi:LLM class flavin-dependent oxidoreductase [Croceicoccus sp. Ery5]|uniref:LLM class flavin-dependent oxidoreductase n=1 Tax=Croceicoccus sp. Ery5 TaxID=1703340 RepID=UPI001E42F5C4|nr:LLM class flavin-dependent oxidoreductase [Croceicoccus sp. Ery5]
MSDRQLSLAAILSATGSHIAGWRHPDCPADGGYNIRRYIEAAQIAEAAKFDLCFLADNYALKLASNEELSRTSNSIALLEPMTALSAMAMMTNDIGLVATMSTTYCEPFHVARMMASLDHISGGRAGWNLVTSANPAEALNFNRDAQDDHAMRYARGGEFVDVVRKLWDSWDDGALIADKESGRYFQPDGVAAIHHKGEHFSVRGPLNEARSPQGHPVIFQAGSSGAGIALAARSADCVFTQQRGIPGAKEFYATIKAAVADAGRDPDQVRVLPGMVPFVAETESEAQAKFDALQALVDPRVGLQILTAVLGGNVDLSIYDIDAPVPEIPETEGMKTFQANLLAEARDEGLSLRELYLRYAAGFGHWRVIGSATQVADVIEEAFHENAADGFAISSAMLPGSLGDFARLVVPELQRRGLFRTEYQGNTLRDRLGLNRPARIDPAAA